MPVIGLPATLECMLNSALQEMTLSSFKVEGRNNQTVVVLRLTSKTTGHTPVTPVQSATYRRKCPSQVSRDRRRAEAHRLNHEQKTNESVPSPSGLFLPTPPSLFYATGGNENEAVSDMFMYDNHCPSSSSNCQDNIQIDTTHYDTDRQTVTVSYKKAVNDQLYNEDLNGVKECDCVDAIEVRKDYGACGEMKEVKDSVSDDMNEAEDVCDDVNEEKEDDREGADECDDNESEAVCAEEECIQRESDSCEPEEPEITNRDVVEYIQKFIQKIDDFRLTHTRSESVQPK